jgi:arabinogalactan endo-1,4-beta-galactosidase
MTAIINRRALGLGLMGLPLAAHAKAATPVRPWPYLIGADVSWIPQDEAEGAVYFEGGVQSDPLDILKNAGFNAIKLRLFVNPENGYSKRAPDRKWCGLEQTIAFAQRIKAKGLHLSLTFHYSDTWADPEHQNKPAAWANLPFSELVDAVHKHTADSLSAMKTAGAAPDLVLIGNETTFGTLWPEGAIAMPVPTGNPQTDANHRNQPAGGSLDNFAALLKAGLAGVHETLPQAKTAVHNHLGRHYSIVQYWMDKRGVHFDALGLSCYQQAAEGDWARTFDGLAKNYPDHGFFAAEYSSRKRYLNDLVHAHPNGWGAYIWEPTRHQEAIFDKDGHNAGEGPRPNLLSQGINSAEAPGAAPVAAPNPAATMPKPPRSNGGRYDANGLMAVYRQMAKDYAA